VPLTGGSFHDLESRASAVANELLSIKPEESVLIISHLDADGLAAGSILFSALVRSGAQPHLRIVKQLEGEVIKEISAMKPKYAVFTDMGSGQKSLLKDLVETKPIVVDHHQPEKSDMDLLEVNPHLSGFDGSNDLSAAGTAYLVAKKMAESNSDLSTLAIVGALGDIQDKGERGAFVGVNSIIAEEAVKMGLMTVKKGLRLYGFESRPLVKCMEYTIEPFLPGLSGDEGACYKLLKGIGIDPRRQDGGWKSVSDLTKDELRTVINGMIKYMISQGMTSREAESIVGAVYVLNNELPETPLRDAREFASSINACGRLGKYGLGVSICLGDRGNALSELKEILQDYRKAISGYLKWLQSSSEAVRVLPNVQAILGGSVVDEKMIGTLASIAYSSKQFTTEKPIIAFAKASKGVKVSGRATPDLVRRGLNLGAVMKEASEKLGGSGGGHNIAAGAQIPDGKEAEFLSIADALVSKTVSGVRL